MRSDQELLAAVSDAFVTWYGMPAIQTVVIARPTAASPHYAIQRRFPIGTVVMHLREDEHGQLVRESAMWRVGHW